MAREEKKILADDGTEFDTLEEAEIHDEFVKAEKDFEGALGRLDTALAKKFKTGDGHPFTYQRSDYWYVREGSDRPALMQVTIYGRYSRVTDDGTVVVDRYSSSNEREIRYEIKQLYRSERAAREEFLRMLKDHKKWLDEDIAEAEGKLAKARISLRSP